MCFFFFISNGGFIVIVRTLKELRDDRKIRKHKKTHKTNIARRQQTAVHIQTLNIIGHPLYMVQSLANHFQILVFSAYFSGFV